MENFHWPTWFKTHRTGVVVALVTAFLVAVWVIKALVSSGGRSASPRQPAAMPALHAFQVVGFYENQAPASHMPGSRGSFVQHAKKLTQVSPLWFRVEPNGRVVDTGVDASVVDFAHRHRVAVLPLFVNARGKSTVLVSASARRKAVANVARVVQQDHLDGASIDFELLHPSARQGLSLFVKDLSQKLKPVHKMVAVSVFPLKGMPRSVNGAYDYRALAASADYLVVMTYDHHYSGGPPGPVAPYGWVHENIKAALRHAPAKRLVLAIGMYGYDWINNGKAGPAFTVPDIRARTMAKAYGAPIHYVASQSQSEFTYKKHGTSHVVWFMGDRSAKARVQLARHYHLKGISLWRLGMEDPAFWKVVP